MSFGSSFSLEFPRFWKVCLKIILAIQGSSSAWPFSTQGYVLSRLLIWTLFNFSIYCLTSFFIAYGRLPVPSTTLHEVNASSCFILNTEQEKIEHFCVLYVLYIIFLQFCHSPLANLLYLSCQYYFCALSLTFLQPYTPTGSLFIFYFLFCFHG